MTIASDRFLITQGKPVFVISARAKDTKVVARMPATDLMGLVQDPRRLEDSRWLKMSDTWTRELAELRLSIQRPLNSGAKKRNLPAYARYLAEAIRGLRGDGYDTPPICVWSPERLSIETFASGRFTDETVMWVPSRTQTVAIDGETQLAARLMLAADPAAYGLTVAQVLEDPVLVEWFNGISIGEARQIFHDRNIMSTRVPTSLAVMRDSRDAATRIARELQEEVIVLDAATEKEVPLAEVVSNAGGRVLKKTDPSWLNFTGLRLLVAATIMGSSGVASDSIKAVDSELVSDPQTEHEVKRAVSWVLRTLAPQLKYREDNVLASMSVLAAIGSLAHRTLGTTEKNKLTFDEFTELMRPVDWTARVEFWGGIAGSVNARGGVGRGGAKEFMHVVVKALSDPSSKDGRKIRGYQPKGALR